VFAHIPVISDTPAPEIKGHDFRHTYATILPVAGYPARWTGPHDDELLQTRSFAVRVSGFPHR